MGYGILGMGYGVWGMGYGIWDARLTRLQLGQLIPCQGVQCCYADIEVPSGLGIKHTLFHWLRGSFWGAHLLDLITSHRQNVRGEARSPLRVVRVYRTFPISIGEEGLTGLLDDPCEREREREGEGGREGGREKEVR